MRPTTTNPDHTDHGHTKSMTSRDTIKYGRGILDWKRNFYKKNDQQIFPEDEQFYYLSKQGGCLCNMKIPPTKNDLNSCLFDRFFETWKVRM